MSNIVNYNKKYKKLKFIRKFESAKQKCENLAFETNGHFHIFNKNSIFF